MRCSIVTAGIFIAVAASSCFGDLVTLKSGQVFEGRAVETQDKVTVFLPYGTIAFYKEEVESVSYGPTPLAVYAERASKLGEGDAKGHYELGLYCEEKKLLVEARSQYQKTIAADADHAQARAKLGYIRAGDEWITYEKYMADKGYVRYKGRYVTEEKAGELESRDKALAREQEGRTIVRTLAYLMTYAGEEKQRESQARLAGVSDPAALGALIEQLDNANAAVRGAVLTALLNYREDAAALAALDEAVNDPAAALRYQARMALNRKQNDSALRAALGTLEIDDDTTRFRVSETLGAIGDPRAIGSLIEYLSWTRPRAATASGAGNRYPVMPRPLHPTYVAGVRAKVAPGVVAYEPILGTYYHGERIIFDPNAAREREVEPEWQDEFVLNHEALNALKAMTGQDLRFDKQAWRNWYLANRWRFDTRTRQTLGALE